MTERDLIERLLAEATSAADCNQQMECDPRDFLAILESLQARVEELTELLENAAVRECNSWCAPSVGEHTSTCKRNMAALTNQGEGSK